MYAAQTQVAHGHHLPHHPAYHHHPPPQQHAAHQQQQQQPNGHSHHPPNGHPPPQQPPPPAPRARQQQAPPPQYARVLVHAIPSVTLHGDTVAIGDANSTSLRDYTPIKVVGDGSFGTVWLADWHGPLPPNTPPSAMQSNARPEYAGKRLVAVKMMKRKWSGWDECRTLKELESLRTIPYHPNVIPLYDCFLRPDTKELYFVFESMEGNLYQLIKSRRNRPLAGGLVASVFSQTIHGLHHIHDKGYFHRDMKPENLLVTTTGLFDYTPLSPLAPPGAPAEKDVVVIVKIADFGLARETSSLPPYTEYVSTRWYRAPEVLLRSRVYSNPVDMWAFGAIMAELVDLRPLFPGNDDFDQVLKISAVLGDPSDEYGYDERGRPNGGGKWDRGIKMMRKLGATFPKYYPQDLYRHFQPSVPRQLIDCILDLLRYDPEARLTAQQCLEHPYVRELARINNPPLMRPAPGGPHHGGPPHGGASLTSVSTSNMPSSHTRTSVIHPNAPRPPFNASNGHLVPPIPDASATHRSAFYASGSSLVPSSTDTRVHPPYAYANSANSSSAFSLPGGERMPNGGWPASGSLPSIPSEGEAMDVTPGGHQSSDPSPMVQDSDGMQEAGAGQSQGKLGKLSLGFGRKWGRAMFGHGDKSALPPVEEMEVSQSATSNGLHRTNSDSTGGRSVPDLTVPNGAPAGMQDPKKMKKEAERMAREAEKQRRALAEKTAREQARAVMQKRHQMAEAGRRNFDDNVMNYIAEQDQGNKGKRSASGVVRQPHMPAAVPSPYAPPPARYASPPGDSQAGWRDQGDGRMNKARRLDWDHDTHTMSSSDVHSVSRLSAISFATVDSDPGPAGGRLPRRTSMFGMGRMASSSSLRTSFDDVPQSVRSSASLSIEHQLAEDFGALAGSDGSGTSSPPPMHMLTLSPTLRPWHNPPDGSGGRGAQRPSYIALPQSRMSAHHLHPNDYPGQAALGPPSPGLINPMFKVPPLPEEPADMYSSPPPTLPPCSTLEAVAEGDYPPLSPMSFVSPEE